MTNSQYNQLKQASEDARDAHARAHGSLDELMRQLDKEFESQNVKQGRALLLKIQDQRDRAEKTFQEAEKAYLRKWEK